MSVVRLVVLALSFVAGTAYADVRHAQVPTGAQGTWIPATDSCPGQAAGRIVLTAQTYEAADGPCTIDWVEERGGEPGAIYSVHMVCRAASGDKPANMIVWIKAADDGAIGPNFGSLVSYRRCP
ncbi:MAG: hypothetical protein HXX10_13360 [Rhodoplanes sp.]|uniref:hypothetical protein n=1 Tax=Rhodoplanes sp. TaxID=1968906 RepID=UPI0017A53A7A|nr:hypothetical protein [Rhodoplanes sp.]NVO15018.1 hypothetical protein [Rhodoplanes sp.]